MGQGIPEPHYTELLSLEEISSLFFRVGQIETYLLTLLFRVLEC